MNRTAGEAPSRPVRAEDRAVDKSLPDGRARERIRQDLDATLIVEAAAGTGKTTELVGRLLALVRSGKTRLPQIVAVTFTEKAAGEMRLRLRAAIERARTSPTITEQERSRLHAALAQLEETRIGTIHGFCADLLREWAVEAQVDPLVQMAAEDEQERAYELVFERWYEAQLADPGEGVRRVLRRRPQRSRGPTARDELRRAGADVLAQRDFDTAWERPTLDRERALDGLLASLSELADWLPRARSRDDFLVRNVIDVERFVREVRAREAVSHGARDYDGLEAGLRELLHVRSWRWKGGARGFASYGDRNQVLAQRDAIKAELERTVALLDADVAACLFTDFRPLVHAYEAYKAKTGRLDFLDLLLRARDLLLRSRATRAELQARYTHLLVDEFQDTDPLQADILLLLAADDPEETSTEAIRPVPGKLFLVGDPKQSIYRFRRADVALYEAIKRRLIAKGASLVELTASFRSVPSIQHAINAAFAPVMQGTEDGSQAQYVPLSPRRDDSIGQPAVVALPVPRPYSSFGKVLGFRIDDSIPDAVAAFVDFLIRKSGWTLPARAPSAEPQPILAQHICLLFKRLQKLDGDVTRPYLRALEARQIPHVLLGGRSLYAREEVTALRNALCAIEWPGDELRVHATLRGPFFAISDEALLVYRHRCGSLYPLGPARESSASELLAPVQDVLDLLRELHLARNHRPFADTIRHLLEATRAHAGVAIWPAGEQALGNLLRMVDLARRFEASRGLSFRSFVEWLERQAQRGVASEAPIVEEGTDGVRMMSVHKAKGLEFPVVILVDPTASAAPHKPSRYVDVARRLWAMPLCGSAPVPLLEHQDVVERHDREESVRLAYVAATRARDLLVVPVVGDEATGSEAVRGWFDVLHPAIYPRPPDRRSAAAAPGCPPFGDDTVLERPAEAETGVWSSVRPGLHRPERGEHRVVFWDPRALELDRQDDAGLRQQRILSADQGGAIASEGERLHSRWQARRTELLDVGRRPSFTAATVTERAALAHDSSCAGSQGPPWEGALAARASEVSIAATTAPTDGRPRGRRFGTLVHATLALVDWRLDAGDGASLLRAAEAEGRSAGATRAEIEAAAIAVQHALAHPLLLRARGASGGFRREVPIVWSEPGGARVEGVIDLLFHDDQEWGVVDFKTDAELEALEATYRAQVAIYVDAVGRTTELPVRGYLLRV